MPDFKGYINDVGGPTANFRYPACEKQLEGGVCPNKKCLAPTPCKNLRVDHTEYMDMLAEIEKIKGVEVLVINALRHQKHISHFSLPEALEVAAKVDAKQTWLTHMSHQIGLHAEEEAKLPEGVRFAYDGLSITL